MNPKLTPEQIEENLACYRLAMEQGSVEGIEVKDSRSPTGFSNKTFSCFYFNVPCRRKPQPKLRAWKTEEVPVGALYKCYDHVSIILSASDNKLYFLSKEGEISWNFLDAGTMLNCSRYSTDNGKTWKECGAAE